MATQAQLDEARAEYHNLAIGLKARVVVDANGERVEYTVPRLPQFKLYIDELEKQLAGTKSSGPMGVYF